MSFQEKAEFFFSRFLGYFVNKNNNRCEMKYCNVLQFLQSSNQIICAPYKTLQGYIQAMWSIYPHVEENVNDLTKREDR